MSIGYGLAAAALQLGTEAILIRPMRHIGPFEAHVTISERHHDELDIVDHPVEQGAQISDHAFKRPPEVVIECAWSDTPKSVTGFRGSLSTAKTGTQSLITGHAPLQIRDMYQKLLALQASAEMMEVVTGKRTYTNMLVKSLTVETDKDSEHILRVTATLRQVLIATVRVVAISAPRENQLAPESTLPIFNKGVKQLNPNANNFNAPDALEMLIIEKGWSTP